MIELKTIPSLGTTEGAQIGSLQCQCHHHVASIGNKVSHLANNRAYL